MPKYSDSSKTALDSAHPKLQELFNEVIKHYDCKILEGYRGQEAQDRYLRLGLSKVQYPAGKHNKRPSEAVDVVPYPVDWQDEKRFFHFAGFVEGVAASKGISVRWGGDWDRDHCFTDQTFNDLPHIELVLDEAQPALREV